MNAKSAGTAPSPGGKKEDLPSPVLGEQFVAALKFAVRLHADHARKQTKIPYLSHLMAAASIALEHGADEEQAIAALLHDAIEDRPRGGETRKEIGEAFGARVLAIVVGCSDSDGENKPSWQERKEAYLAHLRTTSRDTALVSGADKLHNARSILSDLRTLGPAVFDRFTAKKEQTLWYYRQLVEAFTAADTLPRGLLRELGSTVEALEREAR